MLFLQFKYVGSFPPVVVFQIVLLKDAKCARVKLFCQDTQLATEISLRRDLSPSGSGTTHTHAHEHTDKTKDEITAKLGPLD